MSRRTVLGSGTWLSGPHAGAVGEVTHTSPFVTVKPLSERFRNTFDNVSGEIPGAIA
jgi:hypothetical protein